jgi:putative DNA primase/helicase
MSEPQGGQFNEALLKAHSGNDPIEARTLYSSKYKTFTPTHKIVFLTNEMPATDDVGPSMQRRVRIIKFMEDYSPASGRGDFSVEPRLQEDANIRGALRAMAEAAQTYFVRGGLDEPKKVSDWSQAYINDNDPSSAFLDAMCVNDPTGEVQGGAFYKAFDGFCETNGYESMTLTSFGRHMSTKYSKKVRSTGTFYLGIRLKNITDHAVEGDDDD